MIELREGSAADREAILALRGRCFPDDDPEKRDAAFWEWEFKRGRSFLASDGDRVAAHIAFYPQTYVVAGESVPALLAVDAMTDPEYRRQGLFSRVVEFARDAIRNDVRLSGAFQIRDAVLPAMTRGGWQAILRAGVLVRPLTVTAVIRQIGTSVPRNLGTSVAVTRGTEEPRHRGTDVEQLSSIANEHLSRVTIHPGREPAYLQWRWLENPHWTYDIDVLGDAAFIVTRRTSLRGYDTVAVADFAWRNGAERYAKAVLRQALARGKAGGAEVAATLITLGHPALPLLVRAGFLPSPHRFRFLLNNFADDPRVTRAKWAIMWTDTDHL
jgi:GNAT superfamily N-acetyltransferase